MTANVALKKELNVTKRLSEELGDSEQCTRNKVLEIHRVPVNLYTSMHRSSSFKARRSFKGADIEISHKLNARNTPIIRLNL